MLPPRPLLRNIVVQPPPRSRLDKRLSRRPYADASIYLRRTEKWGVYDVGIQPSIVPYRSLGKGIDDFTRVCAVSFASNRLAHTQDSAGG